MFKLHYSNAFGYVVRAVALNLGSRAVGESYAVGDFDTFGVGVEFGSAIGEAVYSRNDISGVFAESVKNNP